MQVSKTTVITIFKAVNSGQRTNADDEEEHKVADDNKHELSLDE